MESVRAEAGYTIDPDWIPKLEIQTSSRRKRKRLAVMNGMFQNDKKPWGYRCFPKQEVVSGDPGNSKSCKTKKRVRHLSNQIEVTPVMDRATVIQENLDEKYPSFVRLMIPSNVTGGFWLSLPKPFCNMHMPKQDTTYFLVDGKGQEFKVKYLADRNGFSGGWRGFSIGHKLLEGDVLVFHLVGNYKIKVYIVRAKSLDKVDAALALVHLSARPEKIDSDCTNTDISRLKQAGEEQLKLAPQVLTHNCFKEDNFQKDNQMALYNQCEMALNQPECGSTRLGLVLEGLISETTSISDAVGSCRLTITPDEFAYCDKSLKLLRANICIKNARLNSLFHHAVTGKETTEYRDYIEALIEKDCGIERNNLEIQMPKLNKAIDRLYGEIDALKAIHTKGLSKSL